MQQTTATATTTATNNNDNDHQQLQIVVAAQPAVQLCRRYMRAGHTAGVSWMCVLRA
jgi:hypothetical protein